MKALTFVMLFCCPSGGVERFLIIVYLGFDCAQPNGCPLERSREVLDNRCGAK